MRFLTPWRRIIAATAASLLIFHGVSAGLSKKDLIVSLKDKRIRDLTSRGLILAFHADVKNNSSAPCFLSRYDYRVAVNQREFLRLSASLESPILIGAGEDVVVALPIKISYDFLFETVGPLEDKAFCDIVGDLFFADQKRREEKVPFIFSGEFPIFKDPSLKFLPLRINNLTVGGADMVYSFKLGNDNKFELIVNAITFKLRFGEKVILEGKVPGDKTVPLQGEKEFSIPFLLDFSETGIDIYDKLQRPSLSCRFSGEITVLSVWGRLVIPFDETGSLSTKNQSE